MFGGDDPNPERSGAEHEVMGHRTGRIDEKLALCANAGIQRRWRLFPAIQRHQGQQLAEVQCVSFSNNLFSNTFKVFWHFLFVSNKNDTKIPMLNVFVH